VSKRKRITDAEIERFAGIIAHSLGVTAEEFKRRGFDWVTINGEEWMQLREPEYSADQPDPKAGYIN